MKKIYQVFLLFFLCIIFVSCGKSLNSYTITFVTNGGNSTPNITFNENELPKLPTNIIREGYTFDEWFFDQALTDPYETTELPNENFTLYANWILVSYNIDYSLDGGINHSENPETYTIIDQITFNSPSKEGFSFDGWYDNESFDGTPITQIQSGSIGHISLYAKWNETQLYSISYYGADGTLLQTTSYAPGADLSQHQPPTVEDNPPYIFTGWGELPPTMPNNNIIKTAKLQYQAHSGLLMINVGENNMYTMPTGRYNDSKSVQGGFLMASTETTYELWYEVRVWAESNGYFFKNLGKEGSDGAIGQAPTSANKEPVTYISYRDVIIWLNAFSEMKGLSPVYRSSTGVILKDSRDEQGSNVDGAIAHQTSGFRLPTNDENEMAARWINDPEVVNQTIELGGRHWRTNNYASGSNNWIYDTEEMGRIAWYLGNTSKTQDVGTLAANDLGIFDLAGNVWEFKYGTLLGNAFVMGGGFDSSADKLQLFDQMTIGTNQRYERIGFRIVKSN